MIMVIANNYLREEHIEEARPLFAKLVEETRKEEGCLQYDLFQDTQAAGHFTFVERWTSQSALDAHMKTTHFTEIVPKIGGFAQKEGGICLYEQAF